MLGNSEDVDALDEFFQVLEELSNQIHSIMTRWYDIESGVSLSSPGDTLKAEIDRSRGRRPKYVIKKEQLVLLRELRFTWSTIAKMYGVSRRTIYNIRMNHGLVSTEFPTFTEISDDELKGVVTDAKKEMPDIGQTMLRGVLESKGIHVSTTRLRECLSNLDPHFNSRWAKPIRRRVYSVPYPNSLWHIDGNHKLVRYVQ